MGKNTLDLQTFVLGELKAEGKRRRQCADDIIWMMKQQGRLDGW